MGRGPRVAKKPLTKLWDSESTYCSSDTDEREGRDDPRAKKYYFLSSDDEDEHGQCRRCPRPFSEHNFPYTKGWATTCLICNVFNRDRFVHSTVVCDRCEKKLFKHARDVVAFARQHEKEVEKMFDVFNHRHAMTAAELNANRSTIETVYRFLCARRRIVKKRKAALKPGTKRFERNARNKIRAAHSLKRLLIEEYDKKPEQADQMIQKYGARTRALLGDMIETMERFPTTHGRICSTEIQ